MAKQSITIDYYIKHENIQKNRDCQYGNNRNSKYFFHIINLSNFKFGSMIFSAALYGNILAVSNICRIVRQALFDYLTENKP